MPTPLPTDHNLVARFTTSDLHPDAIDRMRSAVDALCSDYSVADPAELKARSQSRLNELDRLLTRRLTHAHHRELLEQVGWLTLLIAAVEYDVGNADQAEVARRQALAIGHDLRSPSILGWAHETAAWIELSRSNWRGVLDHASTGLTAAGESEPSGVAIQLSLQMAEASARLDDNEGMERALATARLHLDRHQPPPNLANHFAFDHAKFDLREMRVLLLTGSDDEAERIALRLRAELQYPDGTSMHPMRTSEVLASLGLIEARRGNIEQAVDLANQAIRIGRRSRLSFRQITSAVADELQRHADQGIVRDFLEQRANLLDS